MNELALFAGAGGGILGGKLLGWRTVCAVEVDPYAAGCLAQRQNDGCLPPFPIWDDVSTFDGRPWRGIVDVVSGGFPCQDISAAGQGAGITGQRSGLWREMARIIHEVGPRFVLVENSPVLTSRGLGVVLGDLAAMGYDARWGVLGAVHAGAPHKRERIWIVAHAHGSLRIGRTDQQEWRKERGIAAGGGGEAVADPYRVRELQPEGGEQDEWGWLGNGGADVSDAPNAKQIRGGDWTGRRDRCPLHADGTGAEGTLWWESEPDVGRVAHGVAARVDRLRCLGNGQVPAVVRLAWETLSGNV